jgi:retron-type reverse transcriptase
LNILRFLPGPSQSFVRQLSPPTLISSLVQADFPSVLIRPILNVKIPPPQPCSSALSDRTIAWRRRPS